MGMIRNKMVNAAQAGGTPKGLAQQPRPGGVHGATRALAAKKMMRPQRATMYGIGGPGNAQV